MPTSPAKVSPEAAEEAYIEAYQNALADGLSKPEARVLAKEARRMAHEGLAVETKRRQMGEKSVAYHAAFREAIQEGGSTERVICVGIAMWEILGVYDPYGINIA